MRLATFAQVDARLRSEWREDALGNPAGVLDDAIYLLLSAQTEEYNYDRTYASLKARFPSWRTALGATEDEIYEVIASGGLGRKKARAIKLLLEAVSRIDPSVTLEHLRAASSRRAYRVLISLPGIGHKTACCVLLFALGRTRFPVDTHVWRTLNRLGIASSPRAKPSIDDATSLENKIRRSLRRSLHVNLVKLGRTYCTATRPKCELCPLRSICSFNLTRSRDAG